MEKITPGIYDNLLDQRIEELIGQFCSETNSAQIDQLDTKLLPDYLTRTLAEHIRKALNIIDVDKRYDLANKLIQALSEYDEELGFLRDNQLIPTESNLLTEIYLVGEERKLRPSTPLSFPSLFTGASGSPQLGRELELELESADQMDMLVSFIKTAGINLLFSALKRFTVSAK
ncbi:MAG: hypothetical protein IMF09_10490 [Proteobacteria bacterium]|nr:hypothetical protein [Pseudomonadota bacterium]